MNYTKFAVGNEILAELRQFWSKSLSGVVERERESAVVQSTWLILELHLALRLGLTRPSYY